MLQRWHSGNGYDLAYTLCKYDLSEYMGYVGIFVVQRPLLKIVCFSLGVLEYDFVGM